LRSLLAVLAALLACAGLLSACQGETPAKQLAPLELRGNQLYAGSQRFVASGVVDYLLPFYKDGSSADPTLARYSALDFAERDAMFAAMRKEGINLVRIPLGLPGFDGGYGLGGQAGYLKELVETVSSARQAGLRVVLCWWDSLGWGSRLPEEYRSEWPMVASVVKAVGADPDVIYEPYNEPNGISWSQWEQISEATLKFWRHDLRYRGVLVLDTIGYSSEFSPSAASTIEAADRSLLGGPSQVVFANHLYPLSLDCFCGQARSQWISGVGRWSAQFPILGSEYGIYIEGYRPHLSWMDGLLPVLVKAEGEGFNGVVLFVWNWADPNSLTSGGTKLNAYGQLAERLLWSVRYDKAS